MLRQAQHERREYLSAAFTAEFIEASARTEQSIDRSSNFYKSVFFLASLVSNNILVISIRPIILLISLIKY